MTVPQNHEGVAHEQRPANAAPTSSAAPASDPVTDLASLQRKQTKITEELTKVKAHLAKADERLSSARSAHDDAVDKATAEGKAQIDAVREKVRTETDAVRAAERAKVDVAVEERNAVVSRFKGALNDAQDSGIFTKANLELLGFSAPRGR